MSIVSFPMLTPMGIFPTPRLDRKAAFVGGEIDQQKGIIRALQAQGLAFTRLQSLGGLPHTKLPAHFGD